MTIGKLIALRSGFNDAYFHAWRSNFSSQIKQQALLFDQIGILKLRGMYKSLSTFKRYPDFRENALEPLITELKWLEENGVIFEATIPTITDLESFSKANKHQKVDELDKLITKLLRVRKINAKSLEDMADEIEAIKKQDTIILRILSLVMETTKKVRAVTILPYEEYTRNLPNSIKSDVAQIVINKLPLPNNETAWEQIIDYRNDPENQKNLLSLRRWIRKISTEELSKGEIEEEIEWLMNEFQNHMKVHKLRANTETLEALVKAPLEIIENLIKLKFSKIPEPFFALKKRQINLLEAEINAPGREMSYIIKAQDSFWPPEEFKRQP